MDTNITQIIVELASSQPAAPAIHVPGRTTLRYADLGEQIRYVQERLSGWGIQPGDVVAAALPSRPEMAVAIATLPSSCTLAPLDPSLPSEAYTALLTRMKAKAVLVTTRDEHAIRAAARVLGVAEIDVTPERDAAAGLFTLAIARSGTALAAGNSGDSRLAYILTSSGTTGRPKLVPTEHGAVLCYARAIRDWLHFTPGDVGLHITPVYLGNGLRSGLLNALLAGRSLALLPVGDIDGIFASIEEFQPTFLTANFSLFRGILRRAPEFRAEIAQSRFRFMRWAGRVDFDDADRLEQLFEAPMLTGLSSTETSRISHDPLPPGRRKRGSAGLPVVNEVALLDGSGNIRPNGGPGEIVVRGPMVFRGYLDDHDLTAASFVGDWFRTGDLGRIDEDGYVYFVGRIKDIINRGGEKISPAEIDLTIESLPGVKEAAVFAIPHPSLGEEMVAAVVREENSAIDEAQVVEHVRARAGVRKVPRRVYFVERLPRTDNGKLRRSALPDLLSLEQVAAAPSHAPAPAGTGSLSPLEGAIAGLWSSLLKVDAVGRDDDFFLLGGDSLRGTQLIAHLRTIFGVDLPLLSLFGDAATVAGMARAVEIARAGERAVDRRPDRETGEGADAAIRPRLDRGPVVLAHTQLRMWVLSRLDPDSRAYNVAEAHRVIGSIDVAALHESLLALVQRHEILRTTFVLVDDEPRQIVRPTATVDFQCLDLSETDDQEGALLTLIDGEEQRRFDFEGEPAVRFRLIRLANGDHVLLRVWHHIMWDGWSMSVADRELSVLYAAFANGREPVLPALPIQYADYAVWQREWLQGEVLERQLTYWKAELAGVTTLELPTDRPRPSVLSSRGARAVFNLGAPLARGLKEVGRREGATLFMTLLTAFQVLLARYSGDEDVVVGTPIAGRRRTEVEGLIGFFANTLVLRSDLSGNPMFRDLLGRVRENTLAAYAHQDLPFEKLVEELAPARDLSRNPLFQVLFALQNNPAATLELEGLQVSRLALPRRNVKFDLSLAVRESAAGLRASWEYSTDLFDAATIARMAAHFQVLLEAIVSDPTRRIGELPLLTEAERHQVLVAWNTTTTDYPKDRCVHQLFETQAARTPEAVAVVSEDRQLTYAALNARANQVAHRLRTLGAGPEVLVGICVERSLDLIVGLLGILKAGGAYVPLDPSYPQARVAFMLGDTRAPVLVTQQALLTQLPPFDGHVLCLDRDAATIAAESETNPHCAATADMLAYIMYTSGSTGTPKGVAVRHRGITRLVCNTDYVEFATTDCVAHISNPAFDAATFEIWGALANGASLAIIPRDVALDVPRLAEELRHRGVSTMFLTTTLFNEVVRDRAGAFVGLRQLVVGGEALDPHWVGTCLRAGGPKRLLNGYGPTECTTFATSYMVEAVEPGARTIPIGRPIANTVTYVLDRNRQPVPIGVAGELHIGGAGLARGYWNRPELTTEKFVPDPFSATPGARMYRTGDRVRYLANGDLEFLGRLDDQVKIRGFRIELGEIEAVLGEHPAVRQVVVVAREDTPGDQRLVAYVVPVDAAGADVEPMRTFLRTRLPDYMRPAAYVVLQRLPLTLTGKLDRRALPSPANGRMELGRAFVAPRNALEELVAGVWREVLKLERVGVHDNFFELGGHSLLATQVLARLARVSKVELALHSFFESPTVSALAAEAHKRLGAGEAGAALPMTPAPRGGDLPLSFAQQRLWLLDRLLPGESTYNMPTAWRLQGPLDLPALQRSVAAVVGRHESLRTRVVLRAGTPVQVIDPALPEVLEVTDLSGLAPAAREVRAQALAEGHARRPFDLAAGPLFRAAVLRLASDEHVLLVNVHHIASDGWSVGVFHRELAAAYGAFVRNTEPVFAPLPIQYADYAVWQRAWLQGELLAAQRAYWQRQLTELHPLDLPTDRPRPAVASHQGAHLTVDLPAPVTAALKYLGRGEGTTLFMTLLAAFQVLLSRYSGQTDIAVGSPIAGRGRAEVEELIGFFVNTLVLRSDLSGDPSFRELLARVRTTALEAYTHQDLPFEKLVEELAPARDLSRQPLFQVLFVLQNAPGAPLALEGVAVSRLPRETESAKFDLNVSVRESAAGLHLRWEYSTDLFDAATITRLAGHFQVLLEAIVADPAQRIGELPLLTEAERHQLLVAWNDTATDDPRDGCIQQLFEAQAARTPDAVAAICEDRELTYAALNARANQLAHHLIALGVGPEVLVGLCVERSLEMIVGLLGILKAGGAYVPLDPSYPSMRLAFMLSDTHAPVLITQRALLAPLPPFDGHVLCLDRDAATIAAQPTTDPVCRTTAESLAYVIYTSGSTGTPKGILLPHATLVNLMAWHGSGASGGRVAQFTSISFDVSLQEILSALLFGKTLIVVDDATRLQPERFAAFIQDRAITDLFVPNVVLQYLAQAVVQDPRALHTLANVYQAGEALTVTPVVQAFFEAHPACRLHNHYGPAESHVVTAETLSGTPGSWPSRPAIGSAISNTRLYVLDRQRQPVPVGVTGELYIGGDGLARGYLNRPELTTEKFLPDPFSPVPGARMYRTGDRVRYLLNGDLEFLGRLDDQVKIRGFRIELGEIEAVLSEHPAVRQAVVLAREDSPGDTRLVAYVVPADPAAADTEMLRTFLRTRLPDYMRPAVYVVLEELPFTPTGKLDRRALPAPDAAAYASRAFEAPVGEIETTLAQIWADVLKLERVGRRDHFFESGGHSLLAVSMLERMRQAGLHADVRALFVTPTLAELAAAVAADGRSVEVPANLIPPRCEAITPDMLPLVHLTSGEIERITATVAGGAANVQDIYPLAPLQEGILFHHQMSTEGDPYSMFTVLAFDSRTRLQQYLRALQAVIDRHDALRTALLWEGLPEPVQVVWRRAQLVVEEVNIVGDADVVDQLRSRFDPRHYRLDLHQAPLMRVCIAHDPTNARWVMLRLSHHVLTDGASMEVVRHEIQAHLLGQADQLPVPLPFRNFVAQVKLGVTAEEHQRFFRNMLSDVSESTTPFGLTDVHSVGAVIAEAERAVDASLARRLRERARAVGVSAATVCHLAWAQVLARVSGRDDVVFGTVLFGRMQGGSGADRVLGLFINTLPVRIRVGDEGVQSSVRRTHELLAQLLRHEHAPLALAQRCSAVPAQTPLFSTLLNYRHRGATRTPAATLKAFEGIVSLPGHGVRTNYPLKMAINDLGQDLSLSVQAQTPIDPQRICAFMHSALEQLVGALESAPTTPLRRIDVLPASERALLPDPTIPIGTPSQPSVVGQVVEWAHAAPDRIAVHAAGKEWTYAELTGRAGSLATALQGMGVGRGDVVAIIGPPGFGFVGAMLGVLMSGGAFLTIDPALPTRRKQVMLAEARAKAVCVIGQSDGSEDYLETHDTLAVLRTDVELTSRVGSEERPEQAWSLPVIHGDDPAYVFFTSGSTGQPKAILGCHKGLSHFLQWQRGTFAIGTDDRVSQLIGLTFDALLRDVFLPLTSGATLCVPTGSDRLDTVGWMQREGVTVVHTTPTVMQSWLLDGERRLDLPSLRWLFVSGEPLTDVLVGRWRRIVSGPAQVVNFYGPTETTMIRCFYIIPAELTPGVQPIGVLLPDSQALVLNAVGMLCGIGEIGEIVLRTPFRSLGYLNLPEETLRRFRPNPFRDDANDVVYFTGDRGRYRPDGLLELAGRVDDQVKIRGVRIDPGEVTATLARHEAVRHCVVVGRDDAHGQPQLVGYVVPEAGKHVDARVLRVFLSGQLPQAFVPGTFVILDALPVLPNGKIDREALPSPDFGREEDRGTGEPPRDALEELIAEVWREVLRVEQVGVHDNFFELGGHSLLATQVVARLSRLLQVELPLRRIFEAPTIAELAADLVRLDRGSDEAALERILREVEALTDEETT